MKLGSEIQDGVGSPTAPRIILTRPYLVFKSHRQTIGIMKAMRAFDMIYMFIGKDPWSAGGPLLDAVRTMVYGIYFNGFTRMDMGMASAESVVLFVMILIVTGLQFKLQEKWVNYD